MIRIAFYSAGESWENWEQRLAPHLSSFEFVDLMSEDAIQADIALVWAPPTGRLAACQICVESSCRVRVLII